MDPSAIGGGAGLGGLLSGGGAAGLGGLLSGGAGSGLRGLPSAVPAGGAQPAGPVTSDGEVLGNRGGAGAGEGFGATLGKALGEVNRLQMDAQQAARSLAAGEANVADVVVATQKADIAFQLTLQIRNKLLEAYQDVMRMQV